MIESDDEVEALLLECVRDTFPALLLPTPDPEWSFRYPDLVGMLGLKAAKMLQAAILKDPSLRQLFSEHPADHATDHHAVSCHVSWSTGSAHPLQLVMVPQALVTYALVMAGIYGELTYDACARHALGALAAARALARGERVLLPLLVGLSNIDLADGLDSIDLATGELRRPTPVALARLGRNFRGREVRVLFIGAAEQQLLEVDRWHQGQETNAEETTAKWERLWPKIEAARQEVEGAVNRVRYSLLLASNTDQRIGAIAEITTRLNPLQTGSSAALATGFAAPLAPVTITDETAEQVRSWARRVADEHPRSLDIGMRRLLSAATTRLDPMDGFIDAVMCWENLFGEAQETAFKVCGSLAMLLEPDDQGRRRSLFSRLKNLYEIRSRLVHGSSEPDIKTAYRHRDEALSIALDAMRAAYDLPGLLTLQNGTERYKHVLLGFPSLPMRQAPAIVESLTASKPG